MEDPKWFQVKYNLEVDFMVVNDNMKAKLTVEFDTRLIDIVCTDAADGVFDTVSDAVEYMLWDGLMLQELLEYPEVKAAYDEYNDSPIVE
jgi:hypothetical protein